MQVLLDDLPSFRIRVVGDGPLRDELTRRFSDDPRIEFAGSMDARAVRETLRKTAVFISGCETEALGIAYLEALSQGCAVVMPACGGGVEVEPDLIGTKIQIFPLSFDERSIQIAIRKALSPTELNVHLSSYTGKAVATKYVDTAAAMQ
jgi:glycosyltransferase involved in cell wall biosynthesis